MVLQARISFIWTCENEDGPMRKEKDPDRKKKLAAGSKDRDLYDDDLYEDEEISRQKKSGVRFHRKRTLKDELKGT